MKSLMILGSALFLTIVLHGQTETSFSGLLNFVDPETRLVEGFSLNKGENSFEYHSIRAENSPALLTRCTTGGMAVEWETGSVPSDFKSGKIGFVWMASQDVTNKKLNFDFFVNGIRQFVIPSGEKMCWRLENPEGFTLEFLCVESDQHGDAHGYMKLMVPRDKVVPGKPLSLKLVGETADDNTWVIVYRYKDALAFLQNTIRHNSQIGMEVTDNQKELVVHVKAPSMLSGQTLRYTAGNITGIFQMNGGSEISESTFILPYDSGKFPLKITGEQGMLACCPSLNADGTFRYIDNQSVVETTVETINGKIILKSASSYQPDLVKSLNEMALKTKQGGTIYLMNSSHQDIAWMDDAEKCIIERDTMLLTPLIEKALVDPSYRFDIEDALMLKEYIGRHPEKKQVIKKLLAEGKLSCGSSFIQPYEEMYSGESLVRQFLFGRKWLKDEFGYMADTYWNMDVPGRTLQMPQILAKSGTKYLGMSRFEKGMVRWFSPDGSSVLAYSPGHYATAFRPLQRSFLEASKFISEEVLKWSDYFGDKQVSPVIPLLSDWDMSPAKDYSSLLAQWNKGFLLSGSESEDGSFAFPEIKITSAPEFLHDFEKNAGSVPEIKGERPAVWLYIHGPAHHKAIKASRDADILLTMAEKFASVDAMIKGSFVQYPEKELNEAWEAKIYPDHGWGGKNGQITDDLFWQKYEYARSTAETILQNSLKSIASEINTNEKMGFPVIVFNSLSWERNCPVSFNWNFAGQPTRNLVVRDTENKIVPCQISVISSSPDGRIKSAEITFMASGIPSIGYKTFYVSEAADGSGFEEKFTGIFENRFYRIRFARGGLENIYDKEIGKEVINPEKFLAGEVFTMRSVGNGAGEFSEIQQPDMEGFDRISWHAGGWEQVSSGPVYTAFKTRSPIRYATVELTVKVYNDIKRIDFEVALLNWEGILYREFRMAMPVNVPGGRVAYEVPFGVVEAGKDEMKGVAGERYTMPCSDFHPRGIENWIGGGNDNLWVTLSSDVAVADYIDPTDDPVNYPVLQPVLLASRRSCHSEGNEYLQTGNHYFSFSMTSHAGGWKEGFRFGRQVNEKLRAVLTSGKFRDASLHEEGSFIAVDDSNVWISAIKKTEDMNSFIVRTVEWKGEPADAKVETFIPFNEIRKVNLIEEPAEDFRKKNGAISLSGRPYSIESVEIR